MADSALILLAALAVFASILAVLGLFEGFARLLLDWLGW